MNREDMLAMLAGEEAEESPTSKVEESPTSAEEPTAASEEVQADEEVKPEETKQPDSEEESKVESRYEKLRKGEARQAKAWKKLEEEKEKFQEQKRLLEADREKLNSERINVAEELVKAGEEYSPETYEAVAQNFRDEGEPELAEQAEAMAEDARNKKSNANKTLETEKFKKEWQTSVAELSESNPDLKNPESELHKAVKYLLENKPALQMYPGGFRDSVEVAQMYLDAQALDKVKQENKGLKSELEKLKKKMNLGGGDVAKRPSPQSFNRMSREDQRDALLKMVSQADN